MEQKHCNFCGEVIKGRADKKFCDDQCRTGYNNKLKTDSPQVRHINTILRKNRKILAEFADNDEGKSRVGIKKLAERGFNFTYFTHLYTTKQGSTYYFCYEYGYLKLEGDYYMVVKRKEQPAS
jgi:predicted nucleic acid-binding Zn ribbon protein